MQVTRRKFLKSIAALSAGLIVNPKVVIADVPPTVEDGWELEGDRGIVEHIQHLLEQSEPSTVWGKRFIALPRDHFVTEDIIEYQLYQVESPICTVTKKWPLAYLMMEEGSRDNEEDPCIEWSIEWHDVDCDNERS